MSLRVAICLLFVLGFSIYAWRNWFVSLCAAIVLMAFLQHPDMPKSMFGILGFNLWNVLLLNVLGGWIASRQHEGLIWDMPRSLQIAFLFYLTVVIWAFLRLVYNPTEFYPFATYQIHRELSDQSCEVLDSRDFALRWLPDPRTGGLGVSFNHSSLLSTFSTSDAPHGTANRSFWSRTEQQSIQCDSSFHGIQSSGYVDDARRGELGNGCLLPAQKQPAAVGLLGGCRNHSVCAGINRWEDGLCHVGFGGTRLRFS